MENGPFEDVFPITNGDIPASYVSLPEGNKHNVRPSAFQGLWSQKPFLYPAQQSNLSIKKDPFKV